ncbi:hypothetical protein AVEN_1598-1 [Araneus ventricosus]|uniref:Uncharacterized protein n=1 Tax=Araneus ventricosus TaxID=182803 RepID=A0A4Y2DQ78_ARAVE|nr:hypothetical protein AVEN_1598-1 [Araneus ventricosus]
MSWDNNLKSCCLEKKFPVHRNPNNEGAICLGCEQTYDDDWIQCGLSPGRGGLVLRSRPQHRRVAVSKPDATEDPPCIGPVARQIIRSGQTSSCWCGAEVWRGVPDQVSSSSSDHGLKLRGPSLSSPSVASKRDVNLI